MGKSILGAYTDTHTRHTIPFRISYESPPPFASKHPYSYGTSTRTYTVACRSAIVSTLLPITYLLLLPTVVPLTPFNRVASAPHTLSLCPINFLSSDLSQQCVIYYCTLCEGCEGSFLRWQCDIDRILGR